MEKKLEDMIREAILAMTEGAPRSSSTEAPVLGEVGVSDYPLSEKKPHIIRSSTGKSFDEFTIENVMSGKIGADDCRIAPETLKMQAAIAEGDGRKTFADNLRRAAELIAVPDNRILEIYDKLRPYRSTKEELLGIASELEEKYGAYINGALVREAADLYEKRGRLKR